MVVVLHDTFIADSTMMSSLKNAYQSLNGRYVKISETHLRSQLSAPPTLRNVRSSYIHSIAIQRKPVSYTGRKPNLPLPLSRPHESLSSSLRRFVYESGRDGAR